MADPVLWAGLVMTAGAAGAMAARAARLPAAAGALAGGFLTVSAARAPGWIAAWPDLGLIRHLLVALLCLALGARMDLGALARLSRRVAVVAAAQAFAVAALVSATGALLGMGWRGSLLLAAGAVAFSPTALAAVTAEARARGDFTQHLTASCLIGLLLGCGVAGPVAGSPGLLLSFCGSLLVGVVCGAILLVPLSRMSTRAAILVCGAAGSVLLLAASRWSFGPVATAPMSILAGFVTGNFLPNRALIRETFDDVALPAGVILFALAGSTLLHEEVVSSFLPALLVLGARAAGLFAAAAAASGAQRGLTEAAGLQPMAGASVPALASTLLVAGLPAGRDAGATLAVAAFLSEAAGMVATRWALRRRGEAPALSEAPDDWRGRMR